MMAFLPVTFSAHAINSFKVVELGAPVLNSANPSHGLCNAVINADTISEMYIQVRVASPVPNFRIGLSLTIFSIKIRGILYK